MTGASYLFARVTELESVKHENARKVQRAGHDAMLPSERARGGSALASSLLTVARVVAVMSTTKTRH
jgi:hypothetical protein